MSTLFQKTPQLSEITAQFSLHEHANDIFFSLLQENNETKTMRCKILLSFPNKMTGVVIDVLIAGGCVFRLNYGAHFNTPNKQLYAIFARE